MNRHDEMLNLTRRAVAHFRNGTTDQADSTMAMPVAAYVDAERYQREVERVFKHLPQALALSIEIPQPGDYRADVLPPGVPTLAVEAGVSFGWSKYADDTVAIDHFGASAPGDTVMEKFGFTSHAVAERARALLALDAH